MPSPTSCPHCFRPIPAGSQFCGACGRPVATSSELPTMHLPKPARSRRDGGSDARFLPGAILADRYRIVGLLGRGGMGEVYRADDLKLGQPVALKFLPPGFDASPDRMQRFLDEVRTARQVSHANVCRIYDAGEADGHHFLTMEYVDGEDLASLLRRIGHLPREKAIEIARQLCAGLAASHEIGVLHRDLKPANVMIDGRGRARITDFGLAAYAETIEGAEIRSGTPAYMAPEQLAGREVTVKSDLYALGLVLYELFTGKPAFGTLPAAERASAASQTTPSAPSSFMDGFDPAVERVILRCLEPDPARRPSSALSIAAALPGGDPIAAALAAGETPSPEMVAEAGDTGATSPAIAWGALGVFAAALVASTALAPRTSLVATTRLPKAPAVLEERAREILSAAGVEGTPADDLSGFVRNAAYLHDVQKRVDAGESATAILRATPPAGISFLYRTSPDGLAPVSPPSLVAWADDPPMNLPGMTKVELDPNGRLVSLLVVPGDRDDGPAAEPEWTPLLQATGVDPKSLAPATPEWAPPVFADHRAAWTGTWSGRPDVPLRVEAASAHGRPVALRVAGPWARPADGPSAPEGTIRRIGAVISAGIFVSVIVLASIVALRNVRRGRGDRRGALRLALYLGAMRMLWFLGAQHVASPAELETFLGHFSYAMQRVGLAFVFYLAVEPYARRLWPRMLTSWVRVLDGRFRDPLVGRDILLGCAAGALIAVLGQVGLALPEALGAVSAVPTTSGFDLEALRGPLGTLVSVFAVHTTELLSIIFPVTMILVLRLLLRRTLPAIVIVTVLAMAMFYPGTGSLVGFGISYLLTCAVIWYVLFRIGLLSFAVTFTISSLIRTLPLAPRSEGWLLGAMLFSLAVVAAPALYGFWTARAGRPFFTDETLEPAARPG